MSASEPAATRLVRTLHRGMRSMGYYDAHHPVFEAARREAFDALQAVWGERAQLTLGGAGSHLVVDPEGPPLDDPSARAVAGRLFESSVVAVRLDLEAGPRDLGRLLEALAERAERVREAGGVRAVLAAGGVRGVEVVEVDFAALFAGEHADLAPLVGHDPVAEVALRGVLRFREGGGDVAEAVAVRLEHLDDPDSLGGFLDDLMADAGPQVVEGGDGFLTADDFADQAAQGFLHGQAGLVRRGAPESALEASANALAGALVRLSPDARFALLRRLAGADELPEAEAGAAERLGERLDDALISGAVAAALMEHPEDPDVVRAVGNVIRRMRPVQAKRRALLDALDRPDAAGQRLDGVLWQQICARAEGDPGHGMLELALGAHRARLLEAMQDRLRGGVAPHPGQDVVHTMAPGVIENWTVRTLADLLRAEGRVAAEALEHAEALVTRLDAAGAHDESQVLLRALLERSAAEPEVDARAAARRLLESERGARWSARLLAEADLEGRVLGEVILAALDTAMEPKARARLVARLARLGPETLWDLAAGPLQEPDPRRALALVEAGFTVGERLGAKLARLGLQNRDVHVVDAVLRCLGRHPNRQSVATLAQVAGWKGDRPARRALGRAGASAAERQRFQRTAVGALGLCKSRLAVRPLLDLLTAPKLFSDAATEELRIAAAQALLTNGTPEAQAALEEAGQHKKKAVREIVARVRRGR